MPHIQTGPGQHDTTSRALIVRLDTPSPQILLHIHKKYGRLMQLGGHVELTETPWQAVLTDLFWYDATALTGLPDAEIGEDIRNICLFVLTVCAISWEQAPLTDFEAGI